MVELSRYLRRVIILSMCTVSQKECPLVRRAPIWDTCCLVTLMEWGSRMLLEGGGQNQPATSKSSRITVKKTMFFCMF